MFILRPANLRSWIYTIVTIYQYKYPCSDQGEKEEEGCTLIPFVYNTNAHNYYYHHLDYGN